MKTLLDHLQYMSQLTETLQNRWSWKHVFPISLQGTKLFQHKQFLTFSTFMMSTLTMQNRIYWNHIFPVLFTGIQNLSIKGLVVRWPGHNLTEALTQNIKLTHTFWTLIKSKPLHKIQQNFNFPILPSYRL